MVEFQFNDPSIESQWRALILFGKNSATYKFAFAKALLEVVENQKNTVTLEELSKPFADSIVEHLKFNDKQGSSKSSTFLNKCRDFRDGKIIDEELYWQTKKLGFVNVVDAFQNVHNDIILNKFYEVNPSNKKELIITDNLLKIKELFQYKNLNQEVEARWRLVETAWDLKIKSNILEVQYDENDSLLFINRKDIVRRIDITTARDALNGYQKGKCFYSFQEISIKSGDNNLCHVDHFFPHVNILSHSQSNANLNGVWNLVLADKKVNGNKLAKIPHEKYLTRLFQRNEYYIESKHPLAETIINQTGNTKEKRTSFLQNQYRIALENSSQVRWEPEIELEGNF
jgi:hypothetical protein